MRRSNLSLAVSLLAAAALPRTTAMATQLEVDSTAMAASSYASPYMDLRVVVLTFATEEFADVAINWCVAMRKVNRVSGYAIAALDKTVLNLLKDRAIPAFLLKGYDPSEGPKALWVVRTRLLATLLDMGISAVVSDADAVWVRDPMHLLFTESPPHADVVTMRGSFPPELAERVGGAAANMGFAAFRAGGGTSEFLRRAMLPHTNYWGDDQKGLNYALYACSAAWQGDMRYTESTGPAVGVLSAARPRGAPRTPAPDRLEWGSHLNPEDYIGQPDQGSPPLHLTIMLLPHTSFQRICNPDQQSAFVMHCYVPAKEGSGGIHTAEHKLSGLEKFRLRYVRTDWRDVPIPLSKTVEGLDGYLAQCEDPDPVRSTELRKQRRKRRRTEYTTPPPVPVAPLSTPAPPRREE
eukprot:Hpha_TRINITY_DN5170_c0_g1::TRINITY_DN5170_c0_g1_i1::g.192967::m.192967